jgi:uncharacterized protein with PIN domain
MSADIRKAVFLRLAEEAYERMVKEDQEQMITFDQMEDRALEVGGKLECWLLEHRLELAATRKAQEPACCPTCRKPLRMSAPEERLVLARTGEVKIRRAEGYCASCRRSFSPGRRTIEAGRRRLQPSRVAPDS